MTVSWGTCVSTRCVSWAAGRTLTVPSRTRVSTTDARTPAPRPVVPTPSARLSTTGPSARVPLDTFPTPVPWWPVSNSRRYVPAMPSVLTDRFVMEASAKMFVSMTRLVARTKFVTMVCVRRCVGWMMIVTVRRYVGV